MDKVAVLASGGLDSSVLIVDRAQEAEVFPLYVNWGLPWEDREYACLRNFLAAIKLKNIHAVSIIPTPIQSMYNSHHWSLLGKMPAYDAPDEEVFLPGRNILLLGLASVWCCSHEVSRLAIGLLNTYPYPDTTVEFLHDFSKVLSEGLGFQLSIEAPFRKLNKEDLIRSYPELPLELTTTCLAPKGELHCGQCNKCRERQEAYLKAGVCDKAKYVKGGYSSL